MESDGEYLDSGGGQNAHRGIEVVIDGIGMDFPGAGLDGGDLSVIDDATLRIEPGEFCCILGPSGCGKSTLLRIIHALAKPVRGAVYFDGEPVKAPSPDIGFVFQQFNLLPWRDVLGNVAFGLENRGIAKSDRIDQANKWIERVGLAGFARHFPSQLSGGMQQRVGLARALAIEPKLLLMDEPFGAIDSQTRMLMQEELLGIWQADSRTVVFITHDIEEALFLGDTVHVMGSRPSSIVNSIRVPFSRPRHDSLRGNAEFAATREELWESLKQRIQRDSASAASLRN